MTIMRKNDGQEKLYSKNRPHGAGVPAKHEPVIQVSVSATVLGIAVSLCLHFAATRDLVDEALILLVIVGLPLAFLIGRFRRMKRYDRN